MVALALRQSSVNNISKLVSPSCAKLDELSIAEEIEAIEFPSPRQRIVKKNPVKLGSRVPLRQTRLWDLYTRSLSGGSASFLLRKKLGDSDQDAKQIREDIPGI